MSFKKDSSRVKSIKKRRIGNIVSVSFIVGAEILIDVKQNPFLDNETNKQMFINLLSDFMKDSGINVWHAAADADVLSKCGSGKSKDKVNSRHRK